MTQDQRNTLKNVASFLAIGAAVAGIIYYIKDNEEAQRIWREAKAKASDGYGQVKDKVTHLAEAAQQKISRNA